MDGGVHVVSRTYDSHSAMSLGHTKLHSAAHPSFAHTTSSYSMHSQPSSRSSDTTQGTSNSTLFPPPPSSTPMSESNHVRPTDNVMNQVGEKEQSLFQICVVLRQRLSGVPGFDAFLEQEESTADDDIDPVSLLWRTFRRGFPLLALYNVLRPEKHIQPDLSGMASELKRGKAMTFKFLNALITDLRFKVEDCFIVLDLYGDDTTGFVRVIKTVTRLLDILVDQNIIEDTRRDSAEPGAGGKRSQRQHIIYELVSTERTYVQQLERLQEYQVQCQKTGVIPGDVMHAIFFNLNNLLDFQRRFLIRVEQINAQPESEQNWGKLFILYGDSFSVYEEYITNQKLCEITVMREFEKLKLAGGTSDMQRMVADPSTLYSFLMKPFQRLTKYPLLLDQLYKKGDLDEQRRQDILLGKQYATAVLAKTNEAMEREERLEALEELRGRVEDWKGHKIEHFGELLLFGAFTVVKSDNGPSKDSEREYHVYFFESILLCCKDIDPNKAKNKMKGKSLVDKKGKPKLQLKGRIFMQNVTDVVSTSRPGFYSCQIFWKGDPGIENFTIKYHAEEMMQKWYAKLVEQKRLWAEYAKQNAGNRPSMTSTTQFISMQGQGHMENPYKDEDEEEDGGEMHRVLSNSSYNSQHPTLVDYQQSGWNQSQTSLRSRATTGDSVAANQANVPAGQPGAPPGRMQPPRLPAGTVPALRTQQLAAGSMSPSERFGDSYFSPMEESPVSSMNSRTSTSSSMYPFPRQGHYSEGGYANIPYRSGSREAMNPQGYAANARRPAYQSGPGTSAPLPGFTAARNRSVSSPAINDAQQRRTIDNSNRPPMPDGPIPPHVFHPPPIQRAQTNSPHTASSIDDRMGAPSPSMRSYQASSSMSGYPSTSSSRGGTPVGYGRDTIASPTMSVSTTMSMDAPPPAQLKVKVHAPTAGQVLTLVVPSNIPFQSLRDRIDAKLMRSTNISLTSRGDGNTVKLKYLDDEDYVNIASDEDVQTAFETWREQRGEGINGLGEIELFCQ